MADTDKETKTTVVASPEKEKKIVEKEVVEAKVVEEVEDEDSKTSENGKAEENGKENGTAKEKEESDEKEEEEESTENGGSTDAPSDACCIKRKSTAGVEATDESSVDGASPEKKAKLEEKAAVEVESNGREDAETAA